MKTAKLILVLFVLLVLASVQTQSMAAVAYLVSGNMLVEQMRENDKDEAGVLYDKTSAGAYIGYIMGVCDVTENNRYRYDIPSDATVGQITAIVSKYLKNHPEKWSEPAAVLVIWALQEAFPLKGGK